MVRFLKVIYRFLNKINPFKRRKEVVIPANDIPANDVPANDMPASTDAIKMHFSNLAERKLINELNAMKNAMKNEVFTSNLEMPRIFFQDNFKRKRLSGFNHFFINREKVDLKREDDIEGVPREIIKYTKQENSNWCRILDKIKQLPLEKQDNFRCPILQDVISSPPCR